MAVPRLLSTAAMAHQDAVGHRRYGCFLPYPHLALPHPLIHPRHVQPIRRPRSRSPSRQLHQRNLLQRHRRGLLLLAVLSAVAIWFQWWKFHAQGAPWVQVTKFSLATSFYAAIVGYLIISGPVLANRLLRLRPLRFIGKISYGLYVFHPTVFSFVLLHLRYL